MTDQRTSKRTKLRIISDGNPLSTRVLTDDGQEILGVTAITWTIRWDAFATCTLELSHGQVELDAVASDVTGEVDDG